MLDAVAAGTMTKTDYVRGSWHVRTSQSEKTANGYVNVPRSIGLTTVVEGKIRLDADGERVAKAKTATSSLVSWRRTSRIDEIMEFLKTTQEPQTEATYWHSSKRSRCRMDDLVPK